MVAASFVGSPAYDAKGLLLFFWSFLLFAPWYFSVSVVLCVAFYVYPIDDADQDDER